MFHPSTLFRLFDLFRVQSGNQSTAPRLSVDQATGLMTVVCRTMPAPRVSINQGTGIVTVLSCLDLSIDNLLLESGDALLLESGDLILLETA
jgi:hypothetical protein